MIVVIDASAIGKFLIPDEADAFAELARDVCGQEELHVPAHWPVEVASLLRKARARDRLTDDQATAAAAVAAAIAGTVAIGATPAITVQFARSNELGLSTYDAGYFLLAERLGAPLLTDDGKLRRVALAHGLGVLLP